MHMHTSKKVSLCIVFLILIGLGIHQAKKNVISVPNTPKPLDTASDITTNYACTEGSLAVVYSENEASVRLLDGRTLTLPQVISGSGTRYELDGTVLVSKGDEAFLQENNNITYNNCLANGAAQTTETTKTYSDTGKTFTISYPKELSATAGDIGYSAQWRANVQSLGLTLVKILIPKTQQPKTNFSGATVTVGTSSDTQAIRDCLIATNGEIPKGTSVINGLRYNTFLLEDAGAGNYYTTTSYRIIHNNQCYAVEYTIHSTSLGAYDPSQGINAFDKSTITVELESIVQSVTFL